MTYLPHALRDGCPATPAAIAALYGERDPVEWRYDHVDLPSRLVCPQARENIGRLEAILATVAAKKPPHDGKSLDSLQQALEQQRILARELEETLAALRQSKVAVSFRTERFVDDDGWMALQADLPAEIGHMILVDVASA